MSIVGSALSGMPLFWLSIAFLLGISLGANLKWPGWVWLTLAGIILVCFLVWRILARLAAGAPGATPRWLKPLEYYLIRPQQTKQEGGSALWRLPLAAVAAFVCLGGARYQLAQPIFDASSLAWYNDQNQTVYIEGVVTEPADARDAYTTLRVQVDTLSQSVRGPFQPVSGLLLVRIASGGDWRYGDRLRLEGKLSTSSNQEPFSYREYLARQGLYSEMFASRMALLERDQGDRFLGWIYALKSRALQQIYQLFPDPEASLLAGILLGVDTQIPDEVAQAFRDTGTAHIIAISGFNISILAGFFALLFSRLLGRGRTGQRRGAVVATVAIALYTVLVGPTASVVRAALMGGLGLLGRQLGRQQDGLNSLALVAAVMSLFNPNLLWDVGFQLSFLATLGLILYAVPLSEAFVRLAERRLPTETAQRLAGPVGEYILFTLAAQVMTLPITIYHFRQLSLIALLANPLILPAQPPVMILGGLAMGVGLISEPAGRLCGYLAWPFVAYTIRVVEWLAKAPLGVISLGWVSPWVVFGLYTILLVWTLITTRLKEELVTRSRQLWTTAVSWVKRPKQLPPALIGLVLLGVIGLSALVWREALLKPDGRLHLMVLDVGLNGTTGEAYLIETPTGRWVLVDGGASSRRLSDALGRRLPLLNRRLDCLVVANTAEGHLAGLPDNLERFPVDQVWWAGEATGSRSARLLSETLARLEIPITRAEAGQRLDLGSGARLEMLAVTARGGVMSLEWGSFRVFLPVGLDAASLVSLKQTRLPGDWTALSLAAGGSVALNPLDWIQKLRPQFLLLSVATGDRSGQPEAETLRVVEGYTLLRTDRNGWIELSTDGEEMWVKVERP